ncbi:alpha/beta hydrolase family protein [Stygiolobus azoricus]|uniref:Alpha/beta fold hydrolase n=1 Tax=Stygiolobus azoricus TaxID=41675 RepID=A0A650CRB7_9CREN|nr:S9 family peptidase [Stygiolobus azoricus]QGR20384.1 alpha/beta fold hydrolase [Stygiolobus azoricus]
MEYEDLIKIKPVLDYDVDEKDSQIALIIRENKPEVYIYGENKVNTFGFPEEVVWADSDRLLITIDPEGGERRGIYEWEKGWEKPKPLLVDKYDNFSPMVTSHGILFISNRDGKTLHLYLYDGNNIENISKGEEPVGRYCTNGELIVYSQGIYDDNIYVSDFGGNTIKELSFNESEQIVPSENCFLNKDKFIFLSNHNDTFGLYSYDMKKDEISSIINVSDYDIQEAVVYNEEKILYTLIKDGKSELLQVPNIRLEKGGYIHDLKVVKNSVYYLMSKHSRATDLYVIEGKLSQRLTDSMNGVKDEFVSPSSITYDSDGIKIHALLYSRGNEDKGVVYIHGGPDFQCVDNFNPEIQFLVKKGFKVICPDYRGSTGYGRKFNHLNDKDLGGGDLHDVINAVKVLKVKKVAVTGASYGGYLTMMAVTKYPDLWCSAVAVVPFVNWFTEKQFEREVLKQYDEIKIGNDEALLRDRSPIFFVDRIRAPLMLLAGQNDPRCPAEETIQVVEELKKLGRQVEYKIYEGEGHGFIKIENYIDSIKRTVEFIANHCR